MAKTKRKRLPLWAREQFETIRAENEALTRRVLELDADRREFEKEHARFEQALESATGRERLALELASVKKELAGSERKLASADQETHALRRRYGVYRDALREVLLEIDEHLEG